VKSISVEAPVETLNSALAAERAGVDRLELCASLYDGGTTPSAGLIASVLDRTRIPVFIMVRPRGGGFFYTDDELDVMRRDIELARRFGIAGVVSGVLRPDHDIDVERTRWLVEVAGDLPVTFHRAFDLVNDLDEALEALIVAGVSRVLTSGGAANALDGAGNIAELVDKAAGRIHVMAGGGIRANNVLSVMARAHVGEVHTGVTVAVGANHWPDDSKVRLRKSLPREEGAWAEVDEEKMRQLVNVVKSQP
jgi:copper homeostasis protein